MKPSPAPALTRGIAVLRLLATEGSSSLEQIAAATDWPKSSLLRVLEALEMAGVVTRDPVSKRFSAIQQLVAMPGSGLDLRAACATPMPQLAESLGATVELHQWDGAVLTLIDRAEPEGERASVRARIGFRRNLDELDALTQVCIAWGGCRVRPTHAFEDDARRVRLTLRRTAEIVDLARERGFGADLGCNSNGVSRQAVPLCTHSDELIGVLAVARGRLAEPGQAQPLLAAAAQLNEQHLVH